MKGLPVGTFINMAAVAIGSIAGMLLKQFIPENIEDIIFQAIGLGTLVIGIIMALKVPGEYMLIFIFSLIIGGVLGESIRIDLLLNDFGEWIKTLFSIGGEKFSEGLITAFILYCIGSMTIVGAIEEGIQGKRDLLFIKSTLDGITSVAFAATYGIGVLFSIIPMLIFQGGITIAAAKSKHFFTEIMIAQLSAVGGTLIIAIAINMLKLGEVNTANLLPGLLVVAILSWFKERRSNLSQQRS